MLKRHPAWSWDSKDQGTVLPIGSRLFRSINREEAFEGSSGCGVKVAIIDSGVDNQHPSVGGAVCGWCEPLLDSHGAISYDQSRHQDLFGHGTACAGIIHSVAPSAELYSVRVLGRKLNGQGEVFAAGLQWAIENDMDVVNLSLGTHNPAHFSRFHELVDEAYYRRVVLVTAANNMPVVSFPSLYSTVISTACYEGATGSNPLDFYLNPAPPVEFGANGIDVDVAWLGGGYVKATGNSFAAPNITAIVALLLEKHPGLTPFQVKSVLSSLAANSYTGPDPDPEESI